VDWDITSQCRSAHETQLPKGPADIDHPAPLLIISLIAGAWQFHNTTLRAESIFDKGLLSAAIAISRDVALSDGDAISPSTRRLLADTSGGTIFYHVFAPMVCL